MLLSNLNLLAKAPNGVARLRELILTLAVQGKLVPQDPKDEPASELLKKIRAEKDRLIAEGKIKRDKPLAEIAEEEKPFALPPSWGWIRFGDAAINRDGERIPVSSSDRDNRAKTYDYYGASGVIDKIDGFLFDKTLLLIGEDGANLINRSTPIAFLAHGKYWVNNHAHVIDTTHPELMTYLALFINAISLEPYVTGTAQPKMNQAKLNSIVIALPPLAEQSRIVTRVEELMRLCDALEAKGKLEATQHAQLVSTLLATLTDSETVAQLTENWHRIATHFHLLLDRPEAVDALEQTILQLGVRGLLVPQDPQDEPASELLKKIRAEKDKLILDGKIKRDKPLPPIAEDEQPFALPQGWEWARLVDVALRGPTNGLSPKPQELPTDVRCLSLSATTQGYFKSQCFKYVDVSPKAAEQFFLKTGDLLIQRGNSLDFVGMAAIYDGSDDAFIYPDLMMRLQLSQSANTEFIHAALVCAEGRSYFQRNATGTQGTMPKVNQATVASAPIPLPPLAEQSRIVTRVAQLRCLCADLRQRLATSQSTHAHLAEALVQAVQQ